MESAGLDPTGTFTDQDYAEFVNLSPEHNDSASKEPNEFEEPKSPFPIDKEVVAIPRRRSSEGEAVGPSQGLCSDQYLAARPLDMLTDPNLNPDQQATVFDDIDPNALNDFDMDMEIFQEQSQQVNPQAQFFSQARIYPAQQQYTPTQQHYPPAHQPSPSAQQQYLPQQNPFQQDLYTAQQQYLQVPPYSLPDYYPQQGFSEDLFNTNLFIAQAAQELQTGQSPPFPTNTERSGSWPSQSDEKPGSSPSPSPVLDPGKLAKKVRHSATTLYYGETPTAPTDKPWIRRNATTSGKTSRTGKINHYNPEELYSELPHPLGLWTTTRGKKISYNGWGELADSALSADALKQFIYEHPKSKACKLTLYIQRAPADSKRRYPTSTLDKCCFKQCPMRVHGNKGSIMHGHYRVALDETSYKQGKGEVCNPFLTAGYVHLYCLERFLDLPEICTLPHIEVRADGRQHLSKEPNGTFAPALGGPEYATATNFIVSARTGELRSHAAWETYPALSKSKDFFHSHKSTLNYRLQMAKNRDRSTTVLASKKVSTIAVHRGDLDIYCRARKKMMPDAETEMVLRDLAADDQAMGISAPPPVKSGKKRKASGGEDGEASPSKRKRSLGSNSSLEL